LRGRRLYRIRCYVLIGTLPLLSFLKMAQKCELHHKMFIGNSSDPGRCLNYDQLPRGKIMSITMNSRIFPIPVLGGQVVLILKQGGKIVTQLNDVSQHFWTLLVRSAPPAALIPGTIANIRYSDGKQVYTGACKVQAQAQSGRRLVIKAPVWFKSRPLRRFERYNLLLPATLLLADEEVCEFIPHTEACILNISEGGALVGVRKPLSAQNKRLILLADATEATGVAGGNVYFSARKIRQEEQSSDDRFPHTYGLSFGHLAPLYKQTLSLMLTRMAGGKVRDGDTD
jgi:hypothetical protein